jgi:DNA-binding HxlR family transcriptional regulator
VHGIIRREVFHEVPPRVEYSITEFDVSLNEAVTPLAVWGSKFEKRISRSA